jgi:hypothetical protein
VSKKKPFWWVQAGDLAPSQRTLLRGLRAARHYDGPLSVPLSSEHAARLLAELGFIRIVPSDDLGLVWVTVTEKGRAAAIAGGLW